jgi:hypothetical protein
MNWLKINDDDWMVLFYSLYLNWNLRRRRKKNKDEYKLIRKNEMFLSRSQAFSEYW